ncbi:hypothetical protein CK203_057265 [Vitis vinifera]|uniref:Uncharacterized protein n=1 Tax=Vitis vinifera TaxID=29760 RepID=A0A438GPK4_VITVI|nr:hypothetical protein CK203_057265 [Vitis vinifera]
MGEFLVGLGGAWWGWWCWGWVASDGALQRFGEGVLGRVLPVGQLSSGRQQWEQLRGCWEEKKKKIEPDGSLIITLYGLKIFVLTSFKDTCYIEILPNIQKSNRGKVLQNIFIFVAEL